MIAAMFGMLGQFDSINNVSQRRPGICERLVQLLTSAGPHLEAIFCSMGSSTQGECAEHAVSGRQKAAIRFRAMFNKEVEYVGRELPAVLEKVAHLCWSIISRNKGVRPHVEWSLAELS
ncbi:hypothetical protein ACVIGB_006375 [Bradyrhizobium sp. USDA 4341]